MESLCSNQFKVLELYCGVGGMRYALQEAGIQHSIVAAVDVNNVVNEIYCHNFGKTNHMQRNIQSFTAEEIDSFQADVITLSPPCQPFTRVGLKLGADDPRSQSFLHLLELFPMLKCKPSYFLLENVAGFESSRVRHTLIATLHKCGYVYQEFLISSVQFGIPNSRTRYYILAKLKNLKFPFQYTEMILTEWPAVETSFSSKFCCVKCEEQETSLVKACSNCILTHFLEEKPDSYFETFLVPDKVLKNNAFVYDIVNYNSSRSCCFTKGYGHFARGTGSVLNQSTPSQVSSVFAEVSSSKCSEQNLDLLKTLKLRYFTPREIANLMCFPKCFSFPNHITIKQQYKALGNSVNVHVISRFLLLLISEPNLPIQELT